MSLRTLLTNAGSLAVGVVISQVITIATIPIITRIFAPAEYGVFSLVISILGIAAPAATLTVHYAVVLPDDALTARRILKLSAGLAVATSLLVGLVLAAVGASVAERLGFGDSDWALYFLPMLVLLNGVSDPFVQWQIREKHFRTIARQNILMSLIQRGAQIGLGSISPTALSLLLGQLGALMWRVVVLLAVCRPSLQAARAADGAAPQPLTGLLRDYADFPMYRFPQVLLNTAAVHLPVVVLGYWFGASAAAYFAMARGILLVPVSLVSRSLASALLPQLAEAQRRRSAISPVLLRILLLLSLIGGPPFLVLALVGESFLEPALGVQWHGAGAYVAPLAGMVFLHFLEVPLSQAFLVLRMQRFLLSAEIFGFVFRFGTLTLGGALVDSAVECVSIYAIASACYSVFLIRSIILRSRRTDRSQAVPGRLESQDG